MNNQGGLATLEVILAVTIIAVMSTIAFPKMARMVDTAQLDYEMKIFMSTLDLGKSLNRSAVYNLGIFSSTLEKTGNALQVNIDKNLARYSIKSDMQDIFEPHNLANGFSIDYNNTIDGNIYFAKMNNGHVTITSQFGDKRYIILNTVGRWRIDNQPPQ